MVRHVLERLDLSLNEAKTHFVDASQASFNFLGDTIQMSRGVSTGKLRPNVRPADKSLKKIKARLGELLPLSQLKSGDEQCQARSVPSTTGLALAPRSDHLDATASRAFGFVLAIASKVRAAPLGCLRPCSQP